MCISLFAGTFFTSDAADWIERIPGVVNFPALFRTRKNLRWFLSA